MCVFCAFVRFCAFFDQPSLKDPMCGGGWRKSAQKRTNAHFLTKYKKKNNSKNLKNIYNSYYMLLHISFSSSSSTISL